MPTLTMNFCYHSKSGLYITKIFIENKYQDIEVKCIEADFSSTSIYPQIQKELEGLDIAVLGITYVF